MSSSLIKRLENLERGEQGGPRVSIIEGRGRADEEVAAEVQRIEAKDKADGHESLIIIMSDRRDREA